MKRAATKSTKSFRLHRLDMPPLWCVFFFFIIIVCVFWHRDSQELYVHLSPAKYVTESSEIM